MAKSWFVHNQIHLLPDPKSPEETGKNACITGLFIRLVALNYLAAA
jgi:hypothetical protein